MVRLCLFVTALLVACSASRPPETIAEVPPAHTAPAPPPAPPIPEVEAPPPPPTPAPDTIPEVTPPAPRPPPVRPSPRPPPPTPPRPPTHPTPHPPPPPDLWSCTSDADCVISCPRVEGCCGEPCGCRAAVRRDARDAWTAHYAATCDRVPCPAVACAYEPALYAACAQGRCVGRDGPGL